MLAFKAFQAFIGVFLGTPIGRKTVMALTGAASALFLAFHLVGNLVIFSGSAAYDRYASRLHSVPFLSGMEVTLGVVMVTHVTLGVILFVQNLMARPTAYANRGSAGAKTFASSTMPYTGLVILAFLFYHLWTMKFGPGADLPASERVQRILEDPARAIAYGIGLTAVGFHLSHGATSALLTLGLRHHLHDPWVDVMGRIAATAMSLGFGCIVAWMLWRGGHVG
jgi:succinate dehydrogenase / fumarate reductase, cytochrome b subunit